MSEAQERLQANLSSRYRELDQLEAYARGTQYEGRPPFFNDDAPLLDRAPCVVVPVVKTAARSFVDMVLGEGRTPKVTSRPGEDDAVFDRRFGLGKKDSATLDRGICSIEKQARLASHFRRALFSAQVARTSVGIAGVRNGKLFVDSTKAKWCTATFDAMCPEVVVELEIRYPYIDTIHDEKGKSRERCMLYRRVIDAESDTTFLPIEATENGEPPDAKRWKPDASKTFRHCFGFCPVIWYPFITEECDVAEHDGVAIHDDLLDEIDALNRSRSMRHRAAVYCGDPQMAEFGVADDENPAPLGEQPFAAFSQGVNDHPSNANWQAPARGSMRQGRKRGAGTINTYRNADANAKWLTLDAGALKPLEEDGDDLFAMIADALSWVPVDAKEMSLGSNLSGRTLEWLHKKQTDKCSSIRDDAGQHLILATINLLLRIVYAMPAESLRLPGAPKLKALLERFDVDAQQPNGTTRKEWVPPELTLKWPAYFAPTEADVKAQGDNVRADLNAKIITRRTAVEKMAPFYGVVDVDAYLLELDGVEVATKALEPGDDVPEGPPLASALPDEPAPAAAPADAGASSKAATASSAMPAGAAAPPIAAPTGEPSDPEAAFAQDGLKVVDYRRARASTSGIADLVSKQLQGDFAPADVAWVRAAQWQGPIDVPIDAIDTQNRENWKASGDDLSSYVEKIENGIAKPVVLVNEPTDSKLVVIDGHHRTLAAVARGDKTIKAYVGYVGAVGGPWTYFHSSQRPK